MLDHQLLVVVVYGPLDVPTLVFVLEAAVHDHDRVIVRGVLPSHNIDQSILLDSRQAIRLVGQGMWQLVFVWLGVDLHLHGGM